jgi:hypothetical protein
LAFTEKQTFRIVVGMALLAGVGLAYHNRQLAIERTESGSWSGYYQYGFEVMNFFPDGKNERWLLQAGPSVPCIESGSGFVYIQVRGRTTADRVLRSKSDRRNYSRDLYVSEFLACRPATSEEFQRVMSNEKRRLVE